MNVYTSRPSVLLSLASLLIGTAAIAQTPPTQLIDDLEPGVVAWESNPQYLTVVGNEVFFSADSTVGRVLWKTDGTAAGTRGVGNASGTTIGPMAAVGGQAVFGANNDLWVSDGFSSGTEKIFDVEPIEFPANWQGTGPFVFLGREPNGDEEPWITDGTDTGTQKIVDLVPGSLGSNPRDLHAVEWRNGPFTRYLFFFAADDGTIGRELWCTDGTAFGTFPVVDLGNASKDGIVDTEIAVHVDGSATLTVVFRGEPNAPTSAVGSELFRVTRRWSDPSFTLQSSDEINVGSGSADPADLVTLGDDVLCAAYNPARGRELWKMDVATGQASMVADIVPGSIGAAPQSLLVAPPLPGRPVPSVYFIAYEVATGFELYATDGNTAELVADVDPGPAVSRPDDMVIFDNALWFSANTAATGNELFTSDGSTSGTVLAYEAQPGTSGGGPNGLTVLGSQMLFAADEGGIIGRELHTITAPGNGARVLDVQPWEAEDSSPFFRCTLTDGRIVFDATTSTYGRELWITDGTASGTTLVADLGLGNGSPLLYSEAIALQDGTFMFAEYDPGFLPFIPDGWRFWQSDGTPAGTVSRGSTTSLDPNAPSVSTPNDFEVFRGHVYFPYHRFDLGPGLWRIGTSSGGPSRWLAGNITQPTAVGTKLFFAWDGELGVYDPDVSSTPYKIDINPAGASNPKNLIEFRNRCFFTADDGTHGRELWRSIGYANGTNLVVDANPGSADGARSNSGDLVSTGGNLFFIGDDGTTGWELWKSNGFNGNALVADLYPGPIGSSPSELTWVHVDRVALVANDPVIGRELFLVDVLGNVSSFDIRPGSFSSSPSRLTWTTRHLMFSADDGVSGEEPWYADWIDFNTVGQLADVAVGPEGSFPTSFAAIGSRGFFAADDRLFAGREPWSVDLGSGSFPIGRSCPAPDATLDLRATAPVIGGRFTFWAYENQPAAPGVILMSTIPAAPTFALGCWLHVDFATAVNAGTINAPGGYVQGLQIANNPALLGGRVRMQIFHLPGAGTVWTTNGLEFWLGL